MIDKTAANNAITFFQGLRHTTGQWAGEPFQLLDWQTKVLTDVFGTLKPDGTRQYQKVYIEIPKKNGKSEFAAGLALFLLIADGEPAAQVYSAATDRDQAGIVYQAAKIMVEESTELSSRCSILDGTKRITVPRTNSFYRVLSSETYSKHGYNISGLVVDEVHAHKDRGLIDVLTKGSGAARRQPLFIFITTSGIDRNSICWDMHEYALRVLKFRNPEEYDWVQGQPIDDPAFYAVIYGLKDDDDWTDEKNWYKSNPALGHILNIDEFRKSFQDAQSNVAEENLFKQLRLNIWVKSSLRWMKMIDWDVCNAPVETESLLNKDCYAGLDLASTTDLAALALVFTWEDIYKILMKFWIPEDKALEKEKHEQVPYSEWAKKGFLTLTPGNVIDYSYIREEIREIRENYSLRELAFDRWGATKLIQELQEDGFVLEEKQQGPLIVPFGQGFASMSAPTKELMTLVLSKKIAHGGNPVLRWNADNMIVQQDAAGNIKPDKAKAKQKIDGMVALIMALDRAIKHKSPGPSIYEERGF
jgi:phage terminase large subunit-like protein